MGWNVDYGIEHDADRATGWWAYHLHNVRKIRAQDRTVLHRLRDCVHGLPQQLHAHHYGRFVVVNGPQPPADTRRFGTAWTVSLRTWDDVACHSHFVLSASGLQTYVLRRCFTRKCPQTFRSLTKPKARDPSIACARFQCLRLRFPQATICSLLGDNFFPSCSSRDVSIY